jgi:hypothetical protein
LNCWALTEQAGEQRHEDDTDKCNTSASHKLLHSLRFRTRIVIAVTFEQVDCTPDSKASTEGDNKSLKNIDCTVEKFHDILPESLKA